MKKFTAILLLLVLILSFTACSNKTSSSSEAASDVSTAANQEENSTEKGKILVAYYSATGSTKAVAENIANTVKADLFEITPADPYTNDDLDWTNDNSRVNIEHNDESKRNVSLTQTAPDNWESYDTVFIGYPIWWGIAAWPLNNFVKDNDFTGKTVTENLEDCIIQFADYTGDNTDLFLKALQGCHSPKDYVDMYEQFSQNRIDSVLLIAQTIYERGVNDK